MDPIEIKLQSLPANRAAITLWPFILYDRESYDTCLRVHEEYHWKEQMKWLVIPWFIWYLILCLVYIRVPNEQHPMEMPAYEAERKCRESKNTV